MAIRTNPKLGEIWLVSLDTPAGRTFEEQPGVIISIPALYRIPYRVVVPMTQWQREQYDFAWHVEIEPNKLNGLAQSRRADAKLCRSVAITRFIKKIGRVSQEELARVRDAVALCLGLAPC